MKAQQYIQQELGLLKEFHPREVNEENLEDEIYRALMSKKFRKYSAKPEFITHIKGAIKIGVDKNQPINLTFLHGVYKLWRLEEAPLPDWGELFSMMYFTKWAKTICEIYKPGVWFDYFVDDLIVPIINNIPLEDIEAYVEEYQKILNFMKSYQPDNLKMTITRVGDQFESPEAFNIALEKSVAKFKLTNPQFSKGQLEMVELNAKPTSEQLADPFWREKVSIVHDAYMTIKGETGYHNRPDKIKVFNQPLPAGMSLSVGTTKTSIAKFWAGVGVLEKRNDGFIEKILSPRQLAVATFHREAININGLASKNFQTIRILQ